MASVNAPPIILCDNHLRFLRERVKSTLVEAVIDHLKPSSVTTVEVTKEDDSFVLPKELQTAENKWAHAHQEDATAPKR